MIAKLTGMLDRVYNDSVIIDVNGVGYRVLVSKRAIISMPALTSKLTLWTETIIRNEQPHLCGFLEETEAEWFCILTQVQGVGAKVALAILTALTTSEILDAIICQKTSLITKAEGVGAKLASRIVLELKGKKDLPTINSLSELNISKNNQNYEQEIEDALSALTNLGYNKNDAKNAVLKAVEKTGNITVEELIKASLKEFNNG